MFDSSKKEKKRTYSKRKPKKNDDDFLEDDDEMDYTNVEEILKEDIEAFDSNEEDKDLLVDDEMPPLVDTVADQPEVPGPGGNFQNDPNLGLVRRSKRARKVTSKVKALEAAKKKKTVAKVQAAQKTDADAEKKQVAEKEETEEGPTTSVADVSEGTPIRLYWTPTKSWSTGVVTYVWGDGYFTIEFEDDDKQTGALSYKLEDYEWHINDKAPTKSKSNQKSKGGRKRKRSEAAGDTDYVDAGMEQDDEFEYKEEESEAPPKKRKKLPKQNVDLQKALLSKSARKTITKRQVAVPENSEVSQLRKEKKMITDLVKKITLPKSCDLENPDDIMAKLTWILQNYPPPTES